MFSPFNLYPIGLGQGSPAPSPWTSTDLWPVGNWATKALGERAKPHLCKRRVRVKLSPPPTIGASPQSQKSWGSLV